MLVVEIYFNRRVTPSPESSPGTTPECTWDATTAPTTTKLPRRGHRYKCQACREILGGGARVGRGTQKGKKMDAEVVD